MDFEWDIPDELHGGMPVVHKRCALLNELCKSKRQAREAAAIDATIVNTLQASHGSFIVVLDLEDVRFRPCIYAFVKESLRLASVRPHHTYVVNMPKWGTKVFKLVRRWLSAEDVAACSLDEGPWKGA
jgi:hypothetical protein